MSEIDLASIDAKATEALRKSTSNEEKLVELEEKLASLEKAINALEAKNKARHDELMTAVKASSGEVNNTAIVKLVAAGALLLTSLAGIGNALAPVLPDFFRARYATPVVVTVAAPAPATSAPQVTP